MIVYFADRQLNILGQASTSLPKGLTVIEDLKTDDIETGVAVFECTIPFDKKTRADVETFTEVGNYILRSNDKENEFYQIIEAEIDTRNQNVRIYAEDDGMDLLNEVVGAYEADQAYPISHYINKYASNAGFVIGINEVSSLTRKLSWDGESTATERIASIATQFGGCEISYSFDIDGLTVTKKYINIYKERGKDIGEPLRLNKEVDRIVTTKSIANLATALQCTGGTPEGKDNPITLDGYTYDDGDFYVDGSILKSRNALKRWSRFLWKRDTTLQAGGHIVKQYSYDTTVQKTLCSHAITELKKICDMEVNYEADITEFPENVRAGDRVNIVDDDGELYLSTRILRLETSVAEKTCKATLGEFLIKTNGIAQRVIDLAEQFAMTTKSAERALSIANSAKVTADAAKTQAETALADSDAAKKAAEEAENAANSASKSASQAAEKAAEAQQSVQNAEESVNAMENTVANAQAAAEQARQAAQTAETMATEAQQAAVNAGNAANQSATAAGNAQQIAQNASAKADEAKTAAEKAVEDAQKAATTAEAAKLDAKQAQKDIDSLGENLFTLKNTMSADYARKTDLTESEAKLQTQIKQNAAGISSTASKVQKIDETTNDAQKTLQGAIQWAETSQKQADEAAAEAEAAQNAADEAAQAAAEAQAEADTAKSAADTARAVADQAEATLKAAKADLETVSSRADATEEEIAAAQQAVEAAQSAADNARTDASAAIQIAEESQSVANNAVANAEYALAYANSAANDATLAQKVADEAKGDAEAAQTEADRAAEIAEEAQHTADAALANATGAQTVANEAKTEAEAAQRTADEAAVKVTQAAHDLAVAEQRLADVLANVDATEEEVEAAQADVEAAQSAADAAQAEAEAAQTAANTARANAEAAQMVADEAQEEADQAQAAAREAQRAVDEAEGIVNGLAVRVTKAETKATQNAEEIALRATKKEVAETLSGYSTKEETEAAIKLESKAITSTVKETVEGIEVGGRNLIRNSRNLIFTGYYFYSGWLLSYDDAGNVEINSSTTTVTHDGNGNVVII